MNLNKFFIILIALFSVKLQQTQQASSPNDEFYTAGVVEFSPSVIPNLSEQLENNLHGYLQIISSPEAITTDIIIFPESTLNNDQELTYIPDPDENIIPCEDITEIYHEFLRLISCAAKNAEKYVVINLTEKEACPASDEDKRPCASNGLNIYNTNVVFDRTGRVISRYRKMHLYAEPKNTTLIPEYGVFETDFGVRFGHFVCFDVLFYKPAEEMVKGMHIKDFIMTTMWFGQLPFLTGVQVQHAWAYGNNVNLLAAGASMPATGTTGSGIYNGRQGSIVSVMKRNIGERKIYVGQVPKFKNKTGNARRSLSELSKQRQLSQADISLKQDDLQDYVTKLVNLSNSNTLQDELCYNNKQFCCKFELTWVNHKNLQANSKYYSYRLGVFDGFRSEEAKETNYIKNCAIFSCIGENITDCGKLFAEDALLEPQMSFQSIAIEGSFPKSEEYLLMPNSLRETLLPLPVKSFTWTESDEGSSIKARYELHTPIDDLMAMAIYGNYYDAQVYDGDSAAAALKISSVLFTFVLARLIC